tara:strand:- start:306 stop:857 length:552 start_codon:yes stop_codon:yes gene_type:complete
MKQEDLKRIIKEELNKLREAMPLPLEDEDDYETTQRDEDEYSRAIDMGLIPDPHAAEGGFTTEKEEAIRDQVASKGIYFTVQGAGEFKSPPINLDKPTGQDATFARGFSDTYNNMEERGLTIEWTPEMKEAFTNLYWGVRSLARGSKAGAEHERTTKRAREQGTTNIDTSPFGQSLRRAAGED